MVNAFLFVAKLMFRYKLLYRIDIEMIWYSLTPLHHIEGSVRYTLLDSFSISAISDQTFTTTNCTVFLTRCILFLSSFQSSMHYPLKQILRLHALMFPYQLAI